MNTPRTTTTILAARRVLRSEGKVWRYDWTGHLGEKENVAYTYLRDDLGFSREQAKAVIACAQADAEVLAEAAAVTTTENVSEYITPQVRADRINTWTRTLTERHNERHPNSVLGVTYYAERLTKYVRIVMESGSSKSVHAFVNHDTGDVYKAAGWKAPAKGIRFSLRDDESFARMIEVCDPFGAYLYVR